MATPQQQQAFLEKLAPYAKKAGQTLNMDSSFILSQWAYETGFGSNAGTKYNNYGGLKLAKSSVQGAYQPSDSIHAGYTSIDAFVNDYVRILNLGYYTDWRAKAKPGMPLDGMLKSFNVSPYSQADYSSGFVTIYNKARQLFGQSTTTVPSSSTVTDSKILPDSISFESIRSYVANADVEQLAMIGAGVLLVTGLLKK